MEQSREIIFGVNPVIEKLNSGADEIDEILISDDSKRPALQRIVQEAACRGVRLVHVERKILDSLAGRQGHQGVVARVGSFRYMPFTEAVDRIAAPSINERILALDGLVDPRNLGGLLRTAEAAGVKYVLIPKDRAADVTPTVVKASAGAAYHLHISKVTNLRRAISELKAQGYWVAGLDANSDESIYRGGYPPRLVVVLGSEGAGIRPIILRECDFLLSIPMLGRVPSLNVSVAGAVFLYELLRQSEQG